MRLYIRIIESVCYSTGRTETADPCILNIRSRKDVNAHYKKSQKNNPNLNPRNWKERASTIRPADGQQDRDGALTTLTEGQVARS